MLLAATALVFASVSAADAPDAPEDHPLVARFPGAVLQQWEFREGRFELPLGPLRARPEAEPELTRSRRIEGRIERRLYRIEGRSPVAVYSHYARALQTQGFNQLFVARGSTLDTTQGSAWIRRVYDGLYGQPGVPLSLTEAQDGSARQVLAARLPRANGDVHALLLVNPRTRNVVYVQLDLIESRPSRPGLVQGDARPLQQQLSRNGRAVLAGLRFDGQAVEPSGEVDAALAALAALLAEDPDGRYALVVHGNADARSLADQIALSEARAEALRQRLAERDPDAAERLEIAGLGPLAPQAPPASAAGRAGNTRVELVQY